MEAAALAWAATLWGWHSQTLTWPVHGQPWPLPSPDPAATAFWQLLSSASTLGAGCSWGSPGGVWYIPWRTSPGMANITKGVRSVSTWSSFLIWADRLLWKSLELLHLRLCPQKNHLTFLLPAFLYALCVYVYTEHTPNFHGNASPFEPPSIVGC